MKRHLKTFVISAALFSFAVFAGSALAVTLPQGPALFETSLQSRISSTDTTMTLVANSVRGGGVLSGYNCFTVDEGTTVAEYICGQVSGTTVSGLERAVSTLNGTTTIPASAFSHRVGADVKITDFPLIQRLRNLLNAVEQFPTLLSYVTGTGCTGAEPNSTICDKHYIDTVGSAGAANANLTTKGLTQTSTAVQVASSTSLGSTGAALYVGALTASSSPSVGCNGTTIPGALCVPVARNDGKISPNYIATSSLDNYNFGGAVSIATSTIYTANIGTLTATTSARLPAGTTVGGQPVLLTVPKYSIINSTGVTAPGSPGYATSTAVLTIPAGTLNASSTITVLGKISCGNQTNNQTCTFSLRDIGGTTFASCALTSGTGSSNSYDGTLNFFVANQSSLTTQAGEASCVLSQTNAVASTNAGSAGGGVTTSSFNTASSLGLVMVAQTSEGATSNISSYSIVVNP